MKAICPREGLLSACQLARAPGAAREIRPLRRNFKAVTARKLFSLMATGLGLGVRLEMRSMRVEQPGEAMLPAAKLLSILRESTDDELSLEADESRVLVRGRVNKFEMPSENPA